MTPEEMLIERKEDARARRFITVLEPEAVIARFILGNAVQAVARQFARDR